MQPLQPRSADETNTEADQTRAEQQEHPLPSHSRSPFPASACPPPPRRVSPAQCLFLSFLLPCASLPLSWPRAGVTRLHPLSRRRLPLPAFSPSPDCGFLGLPAVRRCDRDVLAAGHRLRPQERSAPAQPQLPSPRRGTRCAYNGGEHACRQEAAAAAAAAAGRARTDTVRERFPQSRGATARPLRFAGDKTSTQRSERVAKATERGRGNTKQNKRSKGRAHRAAKCRSVTRRGKKRKFQQTNRANRAPEHTNTRVG